MQNQKYPSPLESYMLCTTGIWYCFLMWYIDHIQDNGKRFVFFVIMCLVALIAMSVSIIFLLSGEGIGFLATLWLALTWGALLIFFIGLIIMQSSYDELKARHAQDDNSMFVEHTINRQ